MLEKAKVLICDDDADLLLSLRLSLKLDYEVMTCQSVTQAKSALEKNEFEIVIVDLNFVGQEYDGLHLLEYLNQNHPAIYPIILSGDTNVKRIVEAHRRRYFDFILKGEDFFEVLKISLKRASYLQMSKRKSADTYLTQSPRVQKILSEAQRILSKTDASILILGENGTGKEVLVRHISNKLGQRLVAANMASIPRETAESELFGHEKGAFTGAVASRVGLIEQAHNGLFFMDEVGECTPSLQAKLLRVLQEKEVLPMGAVKPRSLKVRFIAATNRNLNQMVEENLFRLDLLQRLNTFTLILPPLRERPEDILFYAEKFLNEYAENNQCFQITPSGANALMSYSWVGNIRELKNVIQRIVVLSDRTSIDAEVVNRAIGKDVQNEKSSSKIQQKQEATKNDHLLIVLEEYGGNRKLTAEHLGVSEATIYRWLKELGLTRKTKSTDNVTQRGAAL